MNAEQTNEAITEGKGSAGTENETAPQQDRAEAQRGQLDAQEHGDTGTEMKGLVKEAVADGRQFLGDVVEDVRNPERREDEEQGTPANPGRQPGA